jgi:hypothetical protein
MVTPTVETSRCTYVELHYISRNKTECKRLMHTRSVLVAHDEGVTMPFHWVAQSLNNTIFLATIKNRNYSHTTVQLDAT